jgi:hypothetical protein
MSVFDTTSATCARCGEDTEVAWAASINADRRPDLREAVIDRSFQASTCAVCGLVTRLPPHLTYFDLGRGSWIFAEDARELAHWRTHERDARERFDQAFGPAAPASMRAVAAGVKPRLVFGWPALREKLVCADLGLDDVLVELVKAALIAAVPGAPVGVPLVLRLVSGDEQALHFETVDDESEQRHESVAVPRSTYDDIAGDLPSWAALHEALCAELLVDLTRLTIGAPPAEG